MNNVPSIFLASTNRNSENNIHVKILDKRFGPDKRRDEMTDEMMLDKTTDGMTDKVVEVVEELETNITGIDTT